MTHYNFNEVFTSDMDKPHYEISISTDSKKVFEQVTYWFDSALKEEQKNEEQNG